MTGQPGSNGAGRPPRRRTRTQRPWVIIALVLGGAVTMVMLAALMAPDRRQDIWVEAAKSGLQIMTLALATGVVGAMLRDRDALREEQRRHEASLLAFLEEIEATFAQVKTARRMLRTFGFDSPAAMTLTPDQAMGFRTQMALLNEAELTFEIHARKVMAIPGLWRDRAEPLASELTLVYSYLHGVLLEWQHDPTVFQAGQDTSAMSAWPRFRRFVGYDAESTAEFEAGVSDRMFTIGVLIREADAPPPPSLLSRFRRPGS